MDMEVKKIGRDACRVSSWSGGTTTELSIAPENGDYQSRDFLWRLSSATVELEESVFTPLPDFDRIILTLEGEMDICHDGGSWIHLEELSPHRFDGASETRSRGRVTDFNLMLRKGACTGELEALSGSGSWRMRMRSCSFTATRAGWSSWFPGENRSGWTGDRDSCCGDCLPGAGSPMKWAPGPGP